MTVTFGGFAGGKSNHGLLPLLMHAGGSGLRLNEEGHDLQTFGLVNWRLIIFPWSGRLGFNWWISVALDLLSSPRLCFI